MIKYLSFSINALTNNRQIYIYIYIYIYVCVCVFIYLFSDFILPHIHYKMEFLILRLKMAIYAKVCAKIVSACGLMILHTIEYSFC